MLELVKQAPKLARELVDEEARRRVSSKGPREMRGSVYDDIDLFLYLGVWKKLPDGRVAASDYYPLENAIEEEIHRQRLQRFEEPSQVDVAWSLGTEPDNPDFNKTFARVAKKTMWDTPEIAQVLDKYQDVLDDERALYPDPEGLRRNLAVDLAIIDPSMMTDKIRDSLIRFVDSAIEAATPGEIAGDLDSRILFLRLDRLLSPRYKKLLGDERWAALVHSRQETEDETATIQERTNELTARERRIISETLGVADDRDQ